jgi:hypothetical protein
MSKNAKIAVGITIGIVGLCVCICLGSWIVIQISGKIFEESLILDSPEQAQKLAQDIVDYDLPAGYQEQGAFNMGIMKIVIITEGSENAQNTNRPVIMLAAMPLSGSMDEEEMLQIQSNMQRTMGDQNVDMELVEEKTVTIRGQEVSLSVYEGTDEQGFAMKQVVSGFFEGKKGLVTLMIMGQETEWDQTEVDAFIDSIR